MQGKYVDSRNRAVAKYHKKAYDLVSVQFKKGEKEMVRDCADSIGESLQGFIKKAVFDRVKEIVGKDDAE